MSERIGSRQNQQIVLQIKLMMATTKDVLMGTGIAGGVKVGVLSS